jgi:hypothetical protein
MQCENCGTPIETFGYCSRNCKSQDFIRAVDRIKDQNKRLLDEVQLKLETINYMPYSYTDLTAMVRDAIIMLKCR